MSFRTRLALVAAAAVALAVVAASAVVYVVVRDQLRSQLDSTLRNDAVAIRGGLDELHQTAGFDAATAQLDVVDRLARDELRRPS